MAIRLADTARPNNYVDAEHQGTFPVAYAEDIWFEDGTRLSEKTFDGQSVQVDELPFPASEQLGKVYQYIGASGTYEHGCFYECVSVSGQFSWKELRVIKNAVVNTDTEPNVGDYASGSVIVYSGEDTYGFKKGHHYKYVINESHALYLFTGEYTTTHETVHLRLLESALVEDAHVYDTIGECIGYVVSVNGNRVSYYSISDDAIFEIAIYGSSSTPDTYRITDYLDIGGGGSGESSTLYADNPIGSIIPYGGTTAPSGWLICNGMAVSRTTYADLFDAIGTTFGSGDGSTTFNIPDLRNRAVMGAGTNGALGESQNDTTAKNGLSGATSSAGGHSHSVLAYTGAKAAIANIYPKTVIGSNMESYTGSYVENAEYGGTSRAYIKSAGDHTHPVSISSNDSETRPKNVRVNYIIKAQHTSIPADFINAVDETVDDAITEKLHYNGRVNNNVRTFVTSSQTHTFTATKTGLLKAYMHKSGSGYTARLFVNGVSVDQLSCFGEDSSGTTLPWIANGGIDMTLSAFVKEGDVIKIDSDESGSASTDSWYLYATVLQYKA